MTDNSPRAPRFGLSLPNRAVLFGKVRWGKIVFYEVYEDTQKVVELDKHLAGQETISGASKRGE